MSRLSEREISLIRRARSLVAQDQPTGDDGAPTVRRPGSDRIAGWLRHGVARLLDPVRTSLRRGATLQQLRTLDDHLLHDIGLSRGDVEGLAREPFAAWPARARDGGARPPRSAVADRILVEMSDAVAPLRQWNVSRLAAGEMARLGRDTLSDLGYVKGDIDWVPEVMAQRRVGGRTTR